ncbi:OmpA family protein [Acinetobacter rathckeae]|uniref:OmpA family protein n=1 Tax=Acinetobacter rathckeae TaxID=2605272 RepID=UPI0018A27CD5|nr:OmpA family protein [Acinetobacter rathckeae]MBF7687710.1 OmpA family protein [Acinetobacter rathckeae]MBF7688067.1 OmpA family protein [Acinetobacter rathckeae]MBF7695924.1 OmpA family protein [Acinetobacter rathckeae]
MIMNKILYMAFILLSTYLLSACQFGGLNYKQSLMLKHEGFELTSEGWALGLPERILFDFDKSKITPKQQVSLTKLSQELRKYQLYKLKVIGHTDGVGSDEYNAKLSKIRAQSVATIFYQNGFKMANITVIGRGASEPVSPNDTEEHRSNNRRVTIIVMP